MKKTSSSSRSSRKKHRGFMPLVVSIFVFAILSVGLAWAIDVFVLKRQSVVSQSNHELRQEQRGVASHSTPEKAKNSQESTRTSTRTVQVAAPVIPEDVDIPESVRVYVAKDGQLTPRRISDVEKFGYFVVDLSDDAVPLIFSQTPESPNRYRKTFVDIANDRTDEKGQPLPEGRHNFVELFGIPPSLSVVARRFQEDEKKECFANINYDFFRKSRLSVTDTNATALRQEFEQLQAELDRARKKTGKDTTRLAKTNEYALLVKKYNVTSSKLNMIVEAQKRLACEGLLEKYTPGVLSLATVKAIRDFEHKHMIFGWGILSGDTRAGFGRTPLENNFATLRRVLEARVTWSLGIIEDGSVNGVKELVDTWKDKEGKEHKVRNLVDEYTSLLMREMGVDTPEKARDFFLKVDIHRLVTLRVAFVGPPLPEYYQSDMNFSVVIDRGDVYYDAPIDPAGNPRSQPVSRRPRMILYIEYQSQKIPLVRYGTTIGGWRREFKDGKEYFAYKGSDVGPRIWKDIFAAPVWIPPATTPPSSLLKREKIDNQWVTRVNTEEMGPSYASAYGLVAAVHIRNIDDNGRAIWQDNGIRSHGSVDYMSIMRSFSHGCHRLHNHLAIRLFSFILHHRPHERVGQTKLRYNKKFSVGGQNYQVLLDTRGYQFSLVRPIPVMVEEGQILGKLKEPYKGLLPIPGHVYDPDDPNLKGTVSVDPADRAGPVSGDPNAETTDETLKLPPPPASR